MIWIKTELQKEWDKILDDAIIKLEKITENRSLSQNRLYWSYISDLMDCFYEKGIIISKDDLHEWLSQKFIEWNYKMNSITWMRMILRKSTTKLTKKEMSKYIDKIEKYIIQTYDISCPLRTDTFNN